MLVAEDMYVRHSFVHVRFGHSPRDLDIVVHGGDFIVAGCSDDVDWLSQKLKRSSTAGCTKTKRSTSGGCLRVGQHTLATWSSTQKVIEQRGIGVLQHGTLRE